MEVVPPAGIVHMFNHCEAETITDDLSLMIYQMICQFSFKAKYKVRMILIG